MLYDNLELKDFFANILSEIWLDQIQNEEDKKTKQKFKNFVADSGKIEPFKKPKPSTVTFNYQTIENILFYSPFQDYCYLIAKCPDYYILATQKDIPIYPTTSIIKHGLLTPLIPYMKHFNQLVPGKSPTNFVKTIAFTNKIELLLEEKEITSVKTKKL